MKKSVKLVWLVQVTVGEEFETFAFEDLKSRDSFWDKMDGRVDGLIKSVDPVEMDEKYLITQK